MKRILFLSVDNSSRTQIAEGLARQIFGEGVRVQSAGLQPSRANPFAIEVMREVGIDPSGYTSKSLATIDLVGIDTIITLCHEGVCPVSVWRIWHYHWPILDPAGHDELPREEQLEHFRAAREDIRQRLMRLQRELGALDRDAPR